SRGRHTRFSRDWSSDVCSSDLTARGNQYPWGIEELILYSLKSAKLNFTCFKIYSASVSILYRLRLLTYLLKHKMIEPALFYLFQVKIQLVYVPEYVFILNCLQLKTVLR